MQFSSSSCNRSRPYVQPGATHSPQVGNGLHLDFVGLRDVLNHNIFVGPSLRRYGAKGVSPKLAQTAKLFDARSAA